MYENNGTGSTKNNNIFITKKKMEKYPYITSLN